METLIVQPKNKKQLLAVEAVLNALDVAFQKKGVYSREFIAEIKNGEDDIKKGNITRVEDIQNIWKNIL